MFMSFLLLLSNTSCSTVTVFKLIRHSIGFSVLMKLKKCSHDKVVRLNNLMLASKWPMLTVSSNCSNVPIHAVIGDSFA